jgi:MFS family permease
MAYWKFLMRHPRLLSFGVLLTLFSSFGQTFLISVFVPQILTDFSLNSGQFGTLYAAATLCSAASLPFFGKLLDRADLGRYTFTVGLALVFSCWLLALSPNVPVLFLALLGLRLSGQGLLGLTASTAMARMFTDFRGRALSISGAGYPLGEGILPILVVLLLQHVGWRIGWGIAGLFIAVVFLPLIEHLIKGSSAYAEQNRSDARPWSRKQLLTDWRFYLFLPGVLTVPFLLTGTFLYQMNLAEFKGWTAPMMASGFTAYALVRMIGSIAVGPWIDRLGAARMFPFSLIPLALGTAILWTQSADWVLYAFFISAGISQGIAGVIMTALWAQRYGAGVLGRVKSVVSMLVVFSTACSPVLFGWLLAAGNTFGQILPGALILCLFAIASGLLAQRLCFGFGKTMTQDTA